MKLDTDPHRRFNPLTGEWVLVSPQRLERPWQGAIEDLQVATAPPYDPNCYLCPGNSRAGGVRNPSYETTFVFDNDYAALHLAARAKHVAMDKKGLLVAEPEAGICRVMCFSPRHELRLSTMSLADIRHVIHEWTVQSGELGQMPEIHHVQIFQNHGPMMGASNPHPHCQIWGTYSVPELPAKELLRQQSYFASKKRCLLCDYIKVEHEQKVRVIGQDEHFVTLVPFWAVWPFETLICSRRHLRSFVDLAQEEATALARTLKNVTSTYDRLFGVPFPYSMGFHQCPTDGREHPEWHYHAHFYPPLLRSATIRKFMVGFELLATPQRDITPEFAAARLQALFRQP